MDFKLTDEQELLLESLREVIARSASEDYIRECEEKHEPPTKTYEAFREAGFNLLGAPEEYGGTPCDIVTQMIFNIELNRLTSAGYVLGCATIQLDDMLSFGSADQLAKTVESIERGGNPFCMGFTEPDAGSDNNNIQATFERRNGKVYLNGYKAFITGANTAEHCIFMAKDPNQPDPKKQFSTWWVDMKKPGIKIEPIKKIGWFMIPTFNVSFDDVEVEESDIVGIEGRGFINVMKNFEVERLQLAANAAGQAWLAFDDALEYAKQRVQFGKTIGSFQLIQQKLTEMAIRVQNCKSMVLQAAWKKDQGMSINTDAALAKYYCSQAAWQNVDDAVQIFGGLGYCEEVRIARMLRNCRVGRIGGGTEQIMIHIAGRALQRDAKCLEW
ncbi:MAG: acyl-CoA dehydrogenase [Coriobacteriaceae bacterium]|jgi:alkylation response protein AidB-like acyl-CoA dehydrogenase|nr:acyl-CoA dehydrogenase [Coriobacteriaceae bacterium]